MTELELLHKMTGYDISGIDTSDMHYAIEKFFEIYGDDWVIALAWEAASDGNPEDGSMLLTLWELFGGGEFDPDLYINLHETVVAEPTRSSELDWSAIVAKVRLIDRPMSAALAQCYILSFLENTVYLGCHRKTITDWIAKHEDRLKTDFVLIDFNWGFLFVDKLPEEIFLRELVETARSLGGYVYRKADD